ncbi:MAG: helix-turn-helix transcriptional regulator [Rhodoferax sp.]|nr:helix-turn-helix transcriptional regulator [Rhodoferax sp.]MDP3654227.1 helix-turn-helix transcriptional regulator [Rhodoferax sp.]
MTPNTNSLLTLRDAGERYKQLRKAAGKTQTEVAEAAGLRQETLSRFETGTSNDLSAGKLLRLLQVLDMEMEFVPTTRRPNLNDLQQERRQVSHVGFGTP